MTLEAFYENVEGNYVEVRGRMPSDAFTAKYVIGFLEDPTYKQFMELYMNNGNQKDTFRSIHTLKGVAMNLGFGALANICHIITEHFREENGTPCENIEEQVSELKRRYEYLVEQINELAQENEY